MPTSQRLLAAISTALLASAPAWAQGTPASAAPARGPTSAPAKACPPLLQKRFDRLQDESPQSLCQYSGQVLLVVNTASYCGFTPQYKALEDLYAKYKGRGFAVLGFPSNDFAQEKGSNQEVAEFCENTFGVRFPMFVMSSVRGEGANPLFKDLTQQSGTSVKWNFYKYLVGRDGQVVGAWSSMTKPDSAEMVQAIERQLAAPAP